MAQDRSLDVTVDYTGTGSVDDEHKIYLVIFDNPDLDMRHRIGMQMLTENGGTAIARKAAESLILQHARGASR